MFDAATILSGKFWEAAPSPPGGTEGCVSFRTSGSTGEGKVIVLGKDALLLSARAVNGWLDVDGNSVWGLALPLNHVGGFGVVARAYAAGCGFSEYVGKWDAVRFSEWLGRERVTHVSLVPTQVHDLLAAGLGGSPFLRAVVVGGGRLDPGTGQEARDAGWPVLASYGMTETCSQVATQRVDSLGRKFAECPMELLPIWDAEETPDGLLRLKGEALFSGILESGNFRKREGAWFVTNDRVQVSGRVIRPLGRSDSMVKVMGELVDVETVELRLKALCGPCAVAVLAIPDGRKEHSLVAVFEREGQPAAVKTYNSTASGPARVDRWCVMENFPRTDLGKLRRAELAAMIPENGGSFA